MTQLAQSATASLSAQDGLAPGTLTSVTIHENGEIAGVFSNGLTKTMGQMVTATFANNEGLENIGDTLFRSTINSGDPVYSTPGTSSHGSLRSGFLESSNVDLTREFTDMIVTQRGYQASGNASAFAPTHDEAFVLAVDTVGVQRSEDQDFERHRKRQPGDRVS